MDPQCIAVTERYFLSAAILDSSEMEYLKFHSFIKTLKSECLGKMSLKAWQ
jgi:hypothetical protein